MCTDSQYSVLPKRLARPLQVFVIIMKSYVGNLAVQFEKLNYWALIRLFCVKL